MNPIGFMGHPLPQTFRIARCEPVSMQFLEDGGNELICNCLCHSRVKGEYLVIYLEILTISDNLEMRVSQTIDSTSEQFSASIYQNRTDMWHTAFGKRIDQETI